MNFHACTALVILPCLLGLELRAQAQQETAVLTKIAVLPLVPLDGSIKAGAGETLRDLLAAELNRQSPEQDMAGGTRFGAYWAEAVTISPDTSAELASLEAARAELDLARHHIAARTLDAAIVAFETSIARMEVALPAIEGSASFAEVYSGLALALFQRGRDADAEAALTQAILLSPDAPLVEEASSPRLAQEVGQRRAEMARRAEVPLSVDSVPPGARIEVDGRLLGRAPLCVRGLSPGRHLVRAILPTPGPPLARMVEVRSEARVEFRLMVGGSLGALLDLLAENRLDERALAAALEVAAGQGASQVIGGVLSTEGAADGAPKQVRLDAFVIDARSRSLHRIAPRAFDVDLLSAGIELSKMVRALMQAEEAGGTAEALPIALRPGWRPSEVRREVRFGPIEIRSADGGAGASAVRDSAERPAVRRPIDPRKASGTLRPRER